MGAEMKFMRTVGYTSLDYEKLGIM